MKKFLRLIAHSLSARLLGVFFLTALVYSVAARHTVNLVLDRDYLREMIGSHVALHTTYLMEDLGSPPSVETIQISELLEFSSRSILLTT